ncbi:MAG: NADPH:quinone oxidoreductase family protein [Candidatus Theseobacter exili]|nr:NADPH:quinone oxidoreductase family protein [Candidatus Theseobacter exili]
MEAIEVKEFGSTAVLENVEIPEPVLKAGEVLVKVKAAGVNYADIMMRRGGYIGGPHPPFIPGLEASGIVDIVQNKSSFKPGDPVLFQVPCGAYSEKIAVPEKELHCLPGSLSFEEGAGILINYQTAFHLLQTLGQIKQHQTLIVHAAAGGVGTAAVQLAKIWGANVIATAGSQEKLDLAASLGADITINYRKEDFKKIVMQQTKGEGADLVLESVGGDVFQKSLSCLKHLGKLLVYGISSGRIEEVSTQDLLFSSKSVSGFHLSSINNNNKLKQDALNCIFDFLINNKCKVILGHKLSLAEAPRAHYLLERRKSIGKIVLVP